MTLKDGKKLDNILSVSTAASNKYLFHFDSYHALTQWTAGIRLATYEHVTLSEAYTGALIAGKGKTLNNIRAILDRQCTVYDDWVRVRFGAGTPWRRCWCVVSPPDQKEYAKLQKSQKKSNVYDRTPVVLKGDIKFYETKKITKKTKPIATVRDAYSCYAIYPQSKPLIDQSTLVKIEGKITIHSNPETITEGFVFVMPEARPAISGFEIMLQYLFPVFDTFTLYGRPKKLIADVLDTRGLMFAMPSDRQYGYLEIWDVVGLINTDGSQTWSERHWRKQMKDLTSARMASIPDSEFSSMKSSRRNTVSRSGFTTSRGNLRFDDRGSVQSTPSTRQSSPARHARTDLDIQGPRRVGTAPAATPFAVPRHSRSVSENQGYNRYQTPPSRLPQGRTSYDDEQPPTPPPHGAFNGVSQTGQNGQVHRDVYDGDESPNYEPQNLPQLPNPPSDPPHSPVDAPPALTHAPYQQPPIRPSLPPAMMPNASVDRATYDQMADVTNDPLPGGIAAAGAAAAWRNQESFQNRRSTDYNAYGEHEHQMYLNARPPPTDRNSGNRLPTIPASPYVEHAEFVGAAAVYQPTAPPVPEHTELPRQRPGEEFPYRPRSGGSGGQLQRKPVPGRSPSTSQEDDTHSTTSSSLGSLRNDVIDPEALDALNYTETTLHRQQSTSSSRYDDDAASSSTPDYASVASEEVRPRRLPERREDRPRSGILTMIGDPNVKLKSDVENGEYLDAANGPHVQKSADVPSIDFGPTYVLDFNDKRPGTSGTMTQALQDGSFSRSKENLATTPNEQQRHSYISGRTTPNTPLHMRSGSNSPQVSDSRSVAWHPGMASPQPSDRQKLDPEDWVIHRASQQPQNFMYSHGRNKSHTPPPLGRRRSGDWTQLQPTPEGSPGPARPPSRPLSRPQSRGADILLDQRPTSLSAREQEQVARMTNTPLLDMSKSAGHKQRQSSQGLTGYIDYREKEKAAAKASRQGHSPAMQAEIDRRMLQSQQRQMLEVQQRQRQMMEMQQQQMNQQMIMSQSTYAPSIMGMPTGAPSVMGMPTGAPSVMGMPTGAPSVIGMSAGTPSMMGTPSVMGMPTGPGTPQAIVGMAYSTTPGQAQMFNQQQGYFPQPMVTPNTNHMPGGWGTPTPLSPQGQYFQQQQQAMNYGQQPLQQPPTQAYGASFDQAQAAARHAQQQGQYRR
jgi:CCR4-NOT transcriptional complex subunit CAF120